MPNVLNNGMRRRAPQLALLLGAAASAPAARAQGCALCYSAASAAGKAAARALDSGILVLLIPTLILFVGVLVFAIRRADSAL